MLLFEICSTLDLGFLRHFTGLKMEPDAGLRTAHSEPQATPPYVLPAILNLQTEEESKAEC